MRLGQLSRKLSVRQAEIVAFLASKGAVVEDSATARIDDELTRAAIAHFAPEMKIDEPLPDEVIENKNEMPVIPQEQIPAVDVQAETLDGTETEAVAEKTDETNPDETKSVTAVIKAAKVELQGLKVVGKIELPESKKKESTPPGENENGDEKTGKPERRDRSEVKTQTANKGSSTRPRKNPVTLKREREMREAEERRNADLEREKEKRTQFYLRRVKTAPPSRKISLVDEPLNELKDEAPDEPRTLWGKFVKWLTSH
jgi:hypothetical protein